MSTATESNAKTRGRKGAKETREERKRRQAECDHPIHALTRPLAHETNGHTAEDFMWPEPMTPAGVSLTGTAFAGEMRTIALADICPSRWNPRKRFEGIEGLAESIRAKGLVSPLTVRPKVEGSGFYELVAGERRLRACRLAGVSSVPCLVRELSDSEARELIVTENLQREDLHPLEEAAGVESLLVAGETIDTVAQRLGRPRHWVAARARLTNLTKRWRALIDDAEKAPPGWEVGHYELIAKLPQDAQDALIDQGGQPEWWLAHSDTVKELERQLNDKFMRRLKVAPWDLTDPELVPRMGACATCPHRASQQPAGLFDLEGPVDPALDRCLLASCWEKKAEKHAANTLKAAKREHGEKLILQADSYETRKDHKDAIDKWAAKSKYERAKQSDPKARPMLALDGAKAGQITWVKPRPKAQGVRSDELGQRAAKTPEEKHKQAKERAARDRTSWICKQVAEAADRVLVGQKKAKPDPITAPTLDVVGSLAAVWGIQNNWQFKDARFKKCKCDPDRAKVLLDSPPQTVERALWLGVLEVIADDLSYTSGYHPEESLETARLFGPLLGLDMAALEAKAKEDFPDPVKPSAAKVNAKTPGRKDATGAAADEAAAVKSKPARAPKSPAKTSSTTRTKKEAAKPESATEITDVVEPDVARPVPEAWLCKVAGHDVTCVLAKDAGDDPANAAAIAYFRATDDFVVGVPFNETSETHAIRGQYTFRVTGKKHARGVHLIPSNKNGKAIEETPPPPAVAPSDAKRIFKVLRPGYGIRTVEAASAEEAVAQTYAYFRGLKRPPKASEVRVVERPNGDLDYQIGNAGDAMLFNVGSPGGPSCQPTEEKESSHA